MYVILSLLDKYIFRQHVMKYLDHSATMTEIPWPQRYNDIECVFLIIDNTAY